MRPNAMVKIADYQASMIVTPTVLVHGTVVVGHSGSRNQTTTLVSYSLKTTRMQMESQTSMTTAQATTTQTKPTMMATTAVTRVKKRPM